MWRMLGALLLPFMPESLNVCKPHVSQEWGIQSLSIAGISLATMSMKKLSLLRRRAAFFSSKVKKVLLWGFLESLNIKSCIPFNLSRIEFSIIIIKGFWNP